MDVLVDPVWVLASSGGLALFLGLAALHKLRAPQAFAAVLAGYGLLPRWLLLPLAWTLPLLELLAAGGLLLPAARPLAALLAASLLLLYAGALALSLRRGTPVADCGCHFGRQRQAPSTPLVWRNLLLLLLALNLLRPVLDRPLGWFDGLLVGFLLLSAGVFYLLANALIATRNSARELSL